MSETRDYSHFVAHRGGHSSLELAVEGVACAGCIAKIEGKVRALPGVSDARLNFTTKRLNVGWTGDALDAATVVDTVEKAGYRAHPFVPQDAKDEEARTTRWLLTCLAVAGFAAMNIMLLSVSVWSGNASDITSETRDMFHWLSALIALPAAAYAGQPFFRSAWSALRRGTTNMDVPISIGVILALGMSLVETMNHATHAYFDSAIMLLFFLLCGRTLDHAARRRMQMAAGNLAALKAVVAHRLDGAGNLVTVPPDALRPGDRILVKPGERVAADGEVLDGVSDIDDSIVTGETLPRRIAQGAEVYAGSINGSGALTLRVARSGEATLIGEIQQLLDRATAVRSRYIRLADRVARLYAPVVHLTAALTATGWMLWGLSAHDSIIIAIAVLIITCPCALALAVPAVQVVAVSRLFGQGIFLNSGDSIERLAEADTIVFDKTGTLTLPDGRVANRDDVDPVLLQRAARLALSSHHPLAAAVAREAAERQPWQGAAEMPGEGVTALVDGLEARLGSPQFCNVEIGGDTHAGGSLIAFRHGAATALFLIRQTLRPDAVQVVADLRRRGLSLCILSGDRADAVAAVATELGIANWQAGVKPAEKVALIRKMSDDGHRVLMVGDGLNDAAALASAHVSMAPISAADLSKAKADAVFLGEKLAPVLDALSIAKQARAAMMQNLALAIVYNVIAVPVAIAGLVTPLIAAAAMSGSSILVTLNALRLRAPRKDRSQPEPAPEQNSIMQQPAVVR
jgi:Cu2+-exporting ATPase